MTFRFKSIFTSLVILTSSALVGCSSTVDISAVEKAPSHTIPYDSNTQLAKLASPFVEAKPELTGFYPLGDGQEALMARLAVIHTAENSIDLQYYIYRNDSTSSLLTYALYQAAERGVRVRILLDDMQSRNDNTMASLSSHPNIDIRLFNPFENRGFKALGFIGDFDRLNRRMHNKAIIADNTFAITGGRNIGDEYFSANSDVDFGDFDILTLGKVVPEIAVQFDLYWNSAPAIPIEAVVEDITPPSDELVKEWEATLRATFEGSSYTESISELPLVKRIINQSIDFYWAEAELYYDPPSKVYAPEESNFLMHELGSVLDRTESEFLLISPYFVPTEKGADALSQAAQDDIDVTIITNSLASNDVFAVHGWYAKYREQLLEAGVKLYEVKVDPSVKNKRSWLGSSRTSLHAKTFIIDKQDVFVGSFNFDPRSAYINTEMGILLHSPEFAEEVYKEAESNLRRDTYRLSLDEDGDVVWHNDLSGVIYSTEPDASIWLRMGAWFASILPIEDQL
ncbi:phospholipase D family protein [Photobacterium sanctipauli]|uniref:Phospholipase D family protein n=2 Tax=Photobacterium sanctipauli TaxID=1342794 RepID=A0A2T3NUC8_9GAMM|nr:phospholipase D family protein [Photobacterium sanctipauli]PSW19884.1 phospholipase D family protein [Photobacterium sanctipauli]